MGQENWRTECVGDRERSVVNENRLRTGAGVASCELREYGGGKRRIVRIGVGASATR